MCGETDKYMYFMGFIDCNIEILVFTAFYLSLLRTIGILWTISDIKQTDLSDSHKIQRIGTGGGDDLALCVERQTNTCISWVL